MHGGAGTATQPCGVARGSHFANRYSGRGRGGMREGGKPHFITPRDITMSGGGQGELPQPYCSLFPKLDKPLLVEDHPGGDTTRAGHPRGPPSEKGKQRCPTPQHLCPIPLSHLHRHTSGKGVRGRHRAGRQQSPEPSRRARVWLVKQGRSDALPSQLSGKMLCLCFTHKTTQKNRASRGEEGQEQANN